MLGGIWSNYFTVNRWENNVNSERLYFWGYKITADGNFSHEIKRYLLLGRKATKSLDSVLKSRETTLLTKARIAKAMVFPVVMYVCKSWTIKKGEGQKTVAFELWCWRRLLDCKAIQPVHPKGNWYWIFIGRTDAEAEAPILWPPDWRTDSLGNTLMLGKIEGKRRREQQRIRWLGSITNSVDMSLS